MLNKSLSRREHSLPTTPPQNPTRLTTLPLRPNVLDLNFVTRALLGLKTEREMKRR